MGWDGGVDFKCVCFGASKTPLMRGGGGGEGAGGQVLQWKAEGKRGAKGGGGVVGWSQQPSKAAYAAQHSQRTQRSPGEKLGSRAHPLILPPPPPHTHTLHHPHPGDGHAPRHLNVLLNEERTQRAEEGGGKLRLHLRGELHRAFEFVGELGVCELGAH